jgi:hypothetical protein
MSMMNQMWSFALYANWCVLVTRASLHDPSFPRHTAFLSSPPRPHAHTTHTTHNNTHNTHNRRDSGGTLFFFFVAINDKFSWLIEFVCLLCVVSNCLWLYMFNELKRSQNTQMVFAGFAALSLLGAILHWRRPPADDYDSDVTDSDDSDDEGLSWEEKVRRDEEELAQLKRMRERQAKRVADLAKAGQVVTNRKAKLDDAKAERDNKKKNKKGADQGTNF